MADSKENYWLDLGSERVKSNFKLNPLTPKSDQHIISPDNTTPESNINPLTPMSDQDRISPYNINTISSRQVMRIKKNIN